MGACLRIKTPEEWYFRDLLSYVRRKNLDEALHEIVNLENLTCTGGEDDDGVTAWGCPGCIGCDGFTPDLGVAVRAGDFSLAECIILELSFSQDDREIQEAYAASTGQKDLAA